MADDRPITPEQALLAVKAAGLDPDRSLSEQLDPSSGLDEETVKGWVSEAVAEAIGAQGRDESTTPRQRAHQFAENYRDALVKAQSPWFSTKGGDDDAA